MAAIKKPSKPEFQAQILQQVHEIVDELGAGEGPHAIVTVAALFTGPDVDAVAHLTGYSREFVEEIGARMAASGLWTPAASDYAEWFSGDVVQDVSNFMFDVGVAEGTWFRTTKKNSNGNWVFRLIDGTEDSCRDQN